MFVLRELLVNLVATRKIVFRVEQATVGVTVQDSPVGGQMEGEDSEAADTQPIFSAHLLGHLANFLLSGSRAFCLVGGYSTHCWEQVSKDVFTGLPLPLALWTGCHLGKGPKDYARTQWKEEGVHGCIEHVYPCGQRGLKSCFCYSTLERVIEVQEEYENAPPTHTLSCTDFKESKRSSSSGSRSVDHGNRKSLVD